MTPAAHPVLIRMDGGGAVGFGHAKRCIALGRTLERVHGLPVLFCCHRSPALEALLSDEGASVRYNDGGASEERFLLDVADDHPGATLLIDHLFPYEEDVVRRLRRRVKVVMLHNRCPGMYACDAVIFPIAHLDRETERALHERLGPSRFFAGPDFVLLGDEVRTAEAVDEGEYLAVTTGASDPWGMLPTMLEWLSAADGIRVRGLHGADFQHHDTLRRAQGELPAHVTAEPFRHGVLFGATLAVSVFGVTAYELVFRNVPLVTVGHSPQNAEGGERLAERYGASVSLGHFPDLDRDVFLDGVRRAWRPETRDALRARQAGLMDGRGLERVAEILLDLTTGERH